MARTNPHQIAWTAAGLRRAAAEVGVSMPVAYSQAVAADGLRREPNLGVTRLGDGVVLHTSPEDDRHLPVVLGYADARGQWYRDGRRYTDKPEPSIPGPGSRGGGAVTDGQSSLSTPARMRVVALRDPVIEAHGHRLGSAYVEHVYLGLLGPSATWSPEAVSASSTQAVGL